MDTELLNDIASLEAGMLSVEEREGLWMRLSGDPAAGLILCSIPPSTAPVENLSPAWDLPFPVTQKVRLGICEGYLRLFDLNGLQLRADIQKGLALLKGVGGDQLPLCLKREISLDFNLSPVRGSARIVVSDQSGPVDLVVRIDGPTRRRDYIEIWEGGVLLVAHKADKCSVSVPIQGSTPLAVRHTSLPFGIGIRVAPVLFEDSDWLAACLFTAMEGGFAQAATLIPKFAKGGLRLPDLLSKVGAYLEVMRGLTKVEGFRLIPVPAVRGPQSLEASALVYGGLWRGIVACWPECHQLEGPAERPPGDVQPEILELANTVKSAISGGSPAIPAELEGRNSTVLEGWKVMEGLQHLLSGRPGEALTVLDSITPSPEDPFGACGTRSLANHLFVCRQAGKTSGELESSTRDVWKQVFQSLLASQSTVE